MGNLPVRVASLDLGPKDVLYKGKFVLIPGNGSLDLYGGNVSFHNHLTMLNNLPEKDVLGGARYAVSLDQLLILDTSTQFGGIPRDAAEGVSKCLADYLTKHGIPITSEVVLDLKPINSKKLTAWRDLGYASH